MALLNKIGKAALRGIGSKTALGVLAGGAVIKGLSDTVGKSAIDNAMEIAFDNKEADRAMLGTDLTPSLILSQAGFGPISEVAKQVNIGKYGINTGPMPAIAGGAIGSAGGAAIGGVAGYKLARRGFKTGLIGGALGAIGGMASGAAMGGAIGTVAGVSPALSYARNNSQLLSQSPYSNTSLARADALNASGDIVLGMHNSRRGY